MTGLARASWSFWVACGWALALAVGAAMLAMLAFGAVVTVRRRSSRRRRHDR